MNVNQFHHIIPALTTFLLIKKLRYSLKFKVTNDPDQKNYDAKYIYIFVNIDENLYLNISLYEIYESI